MSLEVCAGLETKCETAAHVMDSILNDENTDAVLLIEAKMLSFRLIENNLYKVLKFYTLLLLNFFQIAIPLHLDYLLLEVVN